MTAGMSKRTTQEPKGTTIDGREFWSLKSVPDRELVEGLRRLVGDARRTEARLVAHLAEVDARRLHLQAGYTSLFAYCQKALGLSEMEAFYRITAARLGRKYPLIFEMLAEGQVHLSGICAIRRHVTTANHAELLQEIRGKSKRQIEEMLARRFPRTAIEERLRRLQRLEPLSEDRYLLQVTISKELKEKLELARDLMSHANPNGDLAMVLERAIDPFIAKLSARRFGLTHAPRQRGNDAANEKGSPTRTEDSRGESPATTRSQRSRATRKRQSGPMVPGDSKRRRIPNQVRREVALRDGLRCTYVSDDGTRCETRAFLQLDHEIGWAKGGSDGSENLRIRCAAHNQLRAEQEYGAAHIERAIECRGCLSTSLDTQASARLESLCSVRVGTETTASERTTGKPA
jgi:hypothetical protein